MALIATSVEPPGVARIFFDLRLADSAPDEERRIALAIERAFSMVQPDADEQWAARVEKMPANAA
jgi:hypothetical protein